MFCWCRVCPIPSVTGPAHALYCVSSPQGPATGNAAVNLFVVVCGETWGCALAWLVTINLFFALLSSVTVTGRITYALARDGAFPYSEVLARVHPTFKSPINALLLVRPTTV